MVTRVGGLASGMDIDELVEKLMQAERVPLDKLEQQKQTYEWTRDAYRNVNTKLQTFDTYIADNLILKNFNTKTATVSNSSLVEAIATGSAAGTLTIEGVSQLATAARAIGGQVNAIGTTKLSDLFANSGITPSQNYIEIRAIQKDGTLATSATRIDFTENMTVNDFVSKINSSNAGVSAIFENGRLSITAKNTGDVKGGAEIVVDSGQDVFAAFQFSDTTNLANNGKNAIFQINGIATERSSNTFSISGYNVTLKNTFNSVQTIAEKYIAAQIERNNAATNLTNKTTQFNNAKDAYYGAGAASTPSYTNAHNDAYLAAFGNTLSLSQQETYSKFGKDFWNSLTDDEKQFLVDNSGKSLSELKEAINESNHKNLKSIVSSDAKLETLINLPADEIEKYQIHAYYQTYGSKLKDLSETQIEEIKNFSFDNNDSLDDIYLKMDSLSDEVKTALKSLYKDDLDKFKDDLNKVIKTADVYSEKSKAEDLKSKFNKLGDTFLSGLSGTSITRIISTDFSDPEAVKSLSDDLNISPEQAKALEGLSEDDLNNFKDLANQNINRSNYVKANNELIEAQKRDVAAENTLIAAKADAQSAEILNGDDIDQDKVNSAPSTSPVSITSSTNVDDIVNKIKDFVKTYNGLITELNNLIKETKNRDYPPLTEAQRKEMDEKEIELWEEKAKSGLLRSDSIIREGLSSMRALVYESNPAVSNTKFNTLFSIGITTSKTYNDGGTLEIDEAKLRKALEEDPDAVTTLFVNAAGKKEDTVTVNGVEKKADTRGYLTKLRDAMNNVKLKIEQKAGRSTMTENQYTLGKTLKEIADRISSWKSKLQTIETRYWKQFTSMEQAINKANMQSSLFTQTTY